MPAEMRERIRLLNNLKTSEKTKRKSNKKTKGGRVYLYSLVGKLDGSNITFPVAEAVLARHNEPTISHFMGTVAHAIRKKSNGKSCRWNHH